MPPTDRASLETLFHRAAALPPAQRDAFLDANCGGDQELRARLLGMLQQDVQGTGDLLAGDAARFLDHGALQLGRYTIVRELGSGGMGSVFLARQDDPVQRLVAIKRIRSGLDSAQVVARFELERQALALMSHPCIAQIFDGGTTTDGNPYFVMEYVQGLPLRRFCDERRLDWRVRLELIERVCSAVQHAHQKGVVHRDLKPGNILVTDIGGLPLPKIIDFGIARAVAVMPQVDAAVEGAAGAVGSLAYLSPEQADPGAYNLDARADLYSLGVILYELIAGVPPRQFEGVDPKDALRAFAAGPAPAPAERVTALPPERRQQIAAALGLGEARHLALLRGDLAWILRTALANDPNDRYQSASELAADLRRCRLGQAVLVRTPTLGYRTRVWLRQNRAMAAMSAALAVAVVVSLFVIGAAWLDAAAARDAALAERARVLRQFDSARGVEEFFDLLLFHADPAAPQGRQLGLRELLDRAVPAIDRMFEHRPGAEAAVRELVGHAYKQLAEPAIAESQLLRAMQRLEAGGAEPFEVCSALYRLIQAQRKVGALQRSEPRVEQLLLLGPRAVRPESDALGRALQELTTLVLGGGPDGERPDGAGVIAALDRAVGAWHGSARHAEDLRVLTMVLAESGLLLQVRWQMPESAQCFARVEQLVREMLVDDVRLLPLLRVLASRWLLLERFDEALRTAEELQQDLARLELRGHWLGIAARVIQGAALIGLGRHAEADALLAALHGGPAALAVADSLQASGWNDAVSVALEKDGRLAAFVEHSWQRWRQSGTPRWWVLDATMTRATLMHAIRIVGGALAGGDGPAVRAVHGALLLQIGREAEAANELEQALQGLSAPEPESLADLAIALHRIGRSSDAETALQRLRALAAGVRGERAVRAQTSIQRVVTATR